MPELKEEQWELAIGQVTAPFGIRGEVCVRPETDDPARFSLLKTVCLELPTGEQRALRIKQARINQKGVCLRLEGIDTRDEAEALRGAWLLIPRSQALHLPKDGHWVHELIGLQVNTTGGRELGAITEVIQAPGNDVYVTPHALIPALKQVVKAIDLRAGTMLVELPEEEEE